MEPSVADELDRLFRALVLRIRETRPEHLSRPFEVADVLKTFIPYRATRAEVGVETAEDYEVLLIRLLSGERGLVFSDDVMQDDLRREIESGNPDLRALQSYGTARVTLAQHAMRQVIDAAPPPATASVAAGGAAPASGASVSNGPGHEAPPVTAEPTPPEPRARHAYQPHLAPIPDPTLEMPLRAPRAGCRFCGQTLPDGRDVTFCPHCGQNLKVRRCGGCSAEIEAGWKFCVSCGRASAE